ncbi:hypothetical protein RCL1_000325 [Eukaryota sp. TZLM3-RCL]
MDRFDLIIASVSTSLADITSDSLYSIISELSRIITSLDLEPTTNTSKVDSLLYQFVYSVHNHPALLTTNGPLDKLTLRVITTPPSKFIVALLRILSAFLTVNSSIRQRVIELCSTRSSFFSACTNVNLCTTIKKKILDFDPKVKQSLSLVASSTSSPLRASKSPIFSPRVFSDPCPSKTVSVSLSLDHMSSYSNVPTLDFSEFSLITFLGSQGISGTIDGSPQSVLFNQPSSISFLSPFKLLVGDSGSGLARIIEMEENGGVKEVKTVGHNSQTMTLPNLTKILNFSSQISWLQNVSFFTISTQNCSLSAIFNDLSVVTLFGGKRGQLTGSFSTCAVTDPTDFCIGNERNLFLTDASAVYKVDLINKNLELIAGQLGIKGNNEFINTDGSFYSISGDSAQFNHPSCVLAIDFNCLIISDCCNHCLKLLKFDANISTWMVSLFLPNISFKFPQKLAIDGSKRYLFVTDLLPSVKVIDLVTLSVKTIWTSSDQSIYLTDLIFDSKLNKLFVLDTDTHRILSFSFPIKNDGSTTIDGNRRLSQSRRCSCTHVSPILKQSTLINDVSRSKSTRDDVSVYKSTDSNNVEFLLNKGKELVKNQLTQTRFSVFKNQLLTHKTASLNTVFILRIISLILGENICQPLVPLFSRASKDEWNFLKTMILSSRFKPRLLTVTPHDVLSVHRPQILASYNIVSSLLSGKESGHLSPPFLHSLYQWVEIFMRALHLYTSSSVLSTPLYQNTEKNLQEFVDSEEEDDPEVVYLENELLKKQNELLAIKVEQMSIMLGVMDNKPN